jgi:hypothetical protein
MQINIRQWLEESTLNMGMGVIFMVDETVANEFRALKGDCLMSSAVEARSVDVKSVVRGWCRRRRGSIHFDVPTMPEVCQEVARKGRADLSCQRKSPSWPD